MNIFRTRPDARTLAAFACSAGVSAQFIAGKATRDALYLATLDVTTLPAMVFVTAAVSIALVAVCSKLLERYSSDVVVPAIFAVNAVLLLVEWALVPTSPAWAARAVYLQISGVGPLLASNFWLVATDAFDPRSAKERFNTFNAVGTLSGLVTALIGARVAAVFGVSAMLPVLAAISLVCGWQVRRLALLTSGHHLRFGEARAAVGMGESPRTGRSVIARSSYLQTLAALVLLGTVAATLADYAFKTQVAAVARGDALMHFFSLYYAATSLVALLVQTTPTTFVLEKLGLGTATSSPSGALLLGGAGALAVPGLAAMTVARGAESVFRASLFRTSYELLYTPVPSREKRAAKSLIDVGCDRLGDAVGAGMLRIVLEINPARQYAAILLLMMACSAGSLAIARRLGRGYVETLERNLQNWAVELDLSDVVDVTTRSTILRTVAHSPAALHTLSRGARTHHEPQQHGSASDMELMAIVGLRSNDVPRIVAILRAEQLSPALVPHVIPLLASDALADEAMRSLRKVADDYAGAMADALVGARQPFVVRRRLARVMSACSSQRAADVLMLGLDDLRFEVRFHCARSLATIVRKHSSIRVDPTRILNVVHREVASGKGVWESRRLLDRIDTDTDAAGVDEFIRTRANHSLAHVFTLLSFVLPPVPLQVALHGVGGENPMLRGTALEYLDSVLPREIRDALWPFLDDAAPRSHAKRPAEEVLADLLKANASIVTNLDELRRLGERARQDDAAASGRRN